MTAEKPPITREQATRLAAVLHDMRPRWSIDSIVTLIGKNLDTIPGFTHLTQAAVTIAADPTKDTPAIIFLPGNHWPEPHHPALPQPDPCQDHPEQAAHNCRCCWADVKTGHRPHTHIGKHHQPQDEA